jgi:anti-sigma B factor antagonist
MPAALALTATLRLELPLQLQYAQPVVTPGCGQRGAVDIHIRHTDNATIIDLKGSLKMGDAEYEFRETIEQLLEEGKNKLAINLAGVSEMDSSGIGAVMRAHTSAKRSGGKIRYFAPTKHVVQVLKMVRLNSVLDLSEDEASALAGL